MAGQSRDGCGADYPAKQHGFARNLEHTLVWSDPGYLELALESDDETRKQFPYDFRLLSTFTLEGDKVHHTLTVENLDEEALPFGIGYHPGFQVPFDDKHTAADYELRFSDMESPLCVNNLPKGLVHGNLYYLGTCLRRRVPTSTALMGILGAANVPYDRWMRFMWKMFAIWLGIGAVLVVIAQLIQYGPM